jgi:hypothetical protein
MCFYAAYNVSFLPIGRPETSVRKCHPTLRRPHLMLRRKPEFAQANNKFA